MSTALITGASSGIGLEFAKIFAADNHNLVLVGRDEKALQALANDLTNSKKVAVTVMPADLSDSIAVHRIFSDCTAANIQIDYLVNNAGFGDFGPYSKSDIEKQERMIEVNIRAVTVLTRLFLPGMLARKNGYILNVASIAAFQPGPLMAVYYATKSFVLHFSEALYSELAGTGVHVTCLCPGPTQTGFMAAANSTKSRVFRGRTLPSAADVAQYGYNAMMAKKMTAIPGLGNYLGSQLHRFLPRKWMLAIVHRVQEI